MLERQYAVSRPRDRKLVPAEAQLSHPVKTKLSTIKSLRIGFDGTGGFSEATGAIASIFLKKFFRAVTSTSLLR